MNKKDVTDAVTTIFGTLAVFLQVLIVLVALLAFAALFFAPARRALAAVRDTFAGSELWIAFGIALAATAGSLLFSEYSGFLPCRLCWFQRIAMYPLVVILFVGAVRRDAAAFWYAIALPVIGLGISIYHRYIELNPEKESAGCRKGASCATIWFEEFGYITLPVLAGTAFAAIIVLLLFARSSARARTARPADRPQA
jgi:disulfide bond formation protein DsbB